MSSTLRSFAVAGATVMLVSGVGTTAADAAHAPSLRQPISAAEAVSHSHLTFTHKLVVTGTSTEAADGTPVKRQAAILQHKAAGSKTWNHAHGTKVLKTSSKGVVAWTLTPSTTGHYRIHFRQTATDAGAFTKAELVRVAPKIHLRSVSSAPVLTTSRIVGTIHPSALTGKVGLQAEKSGKWHGVKDATIENGHFTFTFRPTSRTTLHYRVVRHKDSTHSGNFSRVLKVSITPRTLTFGATGADVSSLQKRLRKLHYDVGPASRTYGWDLEHAVTVFEKVQGYHPDGQAGTRVFKALNHPKSVHLRHPYSGQKYAVEVNLKRQVLVIARYGKVWRILDTSSAGGYLYTGSDGQTERAITPTGHFHFVYKIEGTHKSKLGTLYYPSYFNNSGYAIHGEGDTNAPGNVPPYANSHGCVRITDSAVLRYYFHVFTVGTSVWIYR